MLLHLGLFHLGPNVITFRTLLHLGPNVITFRTLLHLGLQQTYTHGILVILLASNLTLSR